MYGNELAYKALPYVGRAAAGLVPYGQMAWDAAAAIPRLMGYGDYKVKKNTVLSGEVPAMHSLQDGVRITHREYVRDISTSVLFTNQSFTLNPGLSETFPWLSAIAQNFEEYEWKGVVVELKSISSDAIASSTNLAMGTIIMCAEYNVTQPAYINKAQMENSFFATSGKPSENLIMGIECDPAQNPLAVHYVRTGAVPSGQDPRLYDVCNVQVATVGSQAAYTVSEMWISYDVILRKPQLDSGLAFSAASAHIVTTTPSAASPMGTTRNAESDTIGLAFTATSVGFPIGSVGRFLVIWSAYGTSSPCVTPSVVASNGSILSTWDAQSSAQGGTLSPTSFKIITMSVVNIPDPNVVCTLSWSGGTYPSSPVGGDVVVTQLNGNYE